MLQCCARVRLVLWRVLCTQRPACEERLDDVKELFKRKYGLDVDAEEEDDSLVEDADGTMWKVTEGRGPLAGLEDPSRKRCAFFHAAARSVPCAARETRSRS